MKIRERTFLYIILSIISIIIFTYFFNNFIDNSIINKEFLYSKNLFQRELEKLIREDYSKKYYFFQTIFSLNNISEININKTKKIKIPTNFENYLYENSIEKIFIFTSDLNPLFIINPGFYIYDSKNYDIEILSLIKKYLSNYLKNNFINSFDRTSNPQDKINILMFNEIEKYKLYTYYIYFYFDNKNLKYYYFILKIDGILWIKKIIKNYPENFEINTRFSYYDEKIEEIEKKEKTKLKDKIFLNYYLNDSSNKVFGYLNISIPWDKYSSSIKVKYYMNIFTIGGLSLFLVVSITILFLHVLKPIYVIQKVLETGELDLFYNLKYLSYEIREIIKMIINFFEQKQVLKSEIEEREYISLQLKESEERYKTLIYNLPDAVCVITDGFLVFANDKIFDLFQIDKDSFFKIDIINYIHIDDRYIVKNLIENYKNLLTNDKEKYLSPIEIRIFDSKKTLKFCLLYSLKINFNYKDSIMLVFSDISRIKEIEKEIIISRTRLSSMINNIPFFAWMKDTNGVFIEVNENFCHFYNKSKDQIIGKTEFDLVPSDKAIKYYEKDLQALTSKKRISYEIVDVINGEQRWFEVFKSPILDEYGTPIGTIGLSRDITEKKLIENQLIESEEKFREIAENLDEAIWLINEETLVYVSPGFNNILETAESFINSNISNLLKFINEENKQNLVNTYQEFLKDEKKEKIDKEIKIVTQNNSTKWLWLRLIKLSHQKIKILGIAEDITKKKEDEKKLQDALKETEKINKELVKLNEELAKEINEREKAKNILRKYEFIVNTSQELMALINKNYIYEAVNDYFCKVFELKRENIIGKSVKEIWGEDLFENIIKPRIEDALKGVSNSYNEWVNLGKLGNRFVASTYYPFFDLENKINEVVIIYHDITELKEYSDQLQELNSNLERMVNEAVEDIRKKDQLIIHQSRLAAMGEMIGNIAHQWRQPLNSLSLLIQNIKDAYDYNELTKEFMEKMENQALKLIEHMSHTIDDFRNFFKPDKQKIKFSIKDSINRVIDIVSATFDNYRISIYIDIKEDIMIEGYPNEFGQVILNLLTNAKDLFLEKKTVNPFVKISVFKKEKNVIIEVQDNGGGFSESVLKNLFQPYFTTKEHGTGIGLYMSKYIIEKNMNGKILAFNKENGACFHLIFEI
ncbi:MAG: PAS domain S-box protein [Spirochaetes bacterium]|nr:PAS domain S-box protein [Spirochaetota bacterium]